MNQKYCEKSGSAALSEFSEAALSILRDVINYFETGNGLYLGKFFWYNFNQDFSDIKISGSDINPSAPLELIKTFEERLEEKRWYKNFWYLNY